MSEGPDLTEQARQSFSNGLELIRAGNIDSAKQVADRVSLEIPYLGFRLKTEIARISHEDGDVDAALDAATKLEEQRVVAIIEIAIICARNKNKEKAEEAIRAFEDLTMQSRIQQEVGRIIDMGKGTFTEGQYLGPLSSSI